MRCLALGQAWKDAGGHIIFVTACQSDGLLQRLRDEGFEIHQLTYSYPDPADWDQTKAVLYASPNAWFVLDGYYFDPPYHQRIKDSGHQLLVIDDMAHLNHYHADIILNQNLHAEQLHYSCEPYTRTLMGTRYVLLRQEFLSWRDRKQEIPEIAQKILVTLGGSDPDNNTLKVIQALLKLDIEDLEVIIVVGVNNPHKEILNETISQSQNSIRLISDATNMPELMFWADMAISGAGSTVWELAYMEVPVALLILADNQERGAEQLRNIGAIKNLGWANKIETPGLVKSLNDFLKDYDSRQAVVDQIRSLVDGEGLQRLMMHMLSKKLRLRPVRKDDCRILWEWANEPNVRTSSFSSGPIPWEDHLQWFAQKLIDPQCHHFIALDEHDVPIGQARFDVQGEEAEIDISISQENRGKGCGSSLIEMTTERMLQSTSVKLVHSYAKVENKTSIEAFKNAGFQATGFEIVHEYHVQHLVRTRG